jgi:hypothetical protein
MTSLLPAQRSTSVPSVVHTYAEDVAVTHRRIGWRRQVRLVPAGLVHAAAHDAERTLCGALASALHEFGRSRHPFERVPAEARCRTCDEAWGVRAG